MVSPDKNERSTEDFMSSPAIQEKFRVQSARYEKSMLPHYDQYKSLGQTALPEVVAAAASTPPTKGPNASKH